MMLLLTLQASLYAQEITQPLTVDEAIQTATQNNKQIMVAKLDEKIALSNYKQTEAVYLPQVGFSYTAITSNNPLNAFGFKLQQQSITQNDFNPALLNNPPGTTDFMTKLQLQQPLINMDMMYQRKSAQKQAEVYQYKTQRTKEYITYQVQQAYMQLQLAYEAETVLQQALTTTTAMYKFTSDRYQQGLLQKSDVLNVEVQVKTMETNVAEAKSNIKNASDYLSMLMNVPLGKIYSTTLLINTAAVIVADSLPANRADFKAIETALQSYDLMIKSSKNSFIPKLNAFANYQLNDNTMFGFGAASYLAGIQLSWNIFNGNQTKSKVASQILERDKMAVNLTVEKDQGNLEINKARRQLTDANYKIKQQQLAVSQAEESFRILQNRYQQGLVNTTDVLFAQMQLSQQKLALKQAVYAANSATTYLAFLTSTINK